MPRPVCKPHSVQQGDAGLRPRRGFVPAPCLCDHLSRRRVTAPLKRPTRDWHPPSRRGNIRRRAASFRPQTVSSLLGLAPGGGYLAARITANAGGLLHRLFTLTPGPSPKGRGEQRQSVSVALIRQVDSKRSLPAPGAIRRRALWSADFPRSRKHRTAIAQPA